MSSDWLKQEFSAQNDEKLLEIIRRNLEVNRWI